MNHNQKSDYRSIVEKLLSEDPFSNWMGVEIIGVKDGCCTVQCSVREDMINGFGVAHGGIVYSLADTALAFSAATGGRVALALNNSISYTKKAHLGDTLTACSEAVNITHRTGLFDIKVTNQTSDIIAFMKGTVYRTEDAL